MLGRSLVVGMLLAVGACGDFGGLDGTVETTQDAGSAVDTGRECTEWGCVDNGANGCTIVCRSYEPKECPPGPWPCGAR